MRHAAHETFDVDLEARTGEVWVLPQGELDLDSVDEFEHTLSIALASEAEHVVIDLRGLELLDSTGLRAVAMACTREEDGRVSLVAGNKAVQGVFNVSGLALELPFRPAAG